MNRNKSEWELSRTGGMQPCDRDLVRSSINIGDIVSVKKAIARKGIVTEKVTVLSKYEHHFLVLNSRGYKTSVMYIDLFTEPEEVEE